MGQGIERQIGCTGFRWVSIPVRSRLTDNRIVRFQNIAFVSTVIVACTIFIFGIKGWASPASIVTGANMWMNPLNIPPGQSPPVYCNNEAFDYIYDPNWKYLNNSCISPSVDDVFQKGTGHPGAFWVTTYISHAVLKDSSCNVTTKTCGAYHRAVQVGPNENYFIESVEKYDLSAQLAVQIPSMDYDGRTGNAKLYVKKPNGTIEELSDASKLLVTRKVSEWISLFGLESLDSTASDSLYSVPESVGKCRYRMCGLVLIFEIEVANVFNFWDFPRENFVLLHLSVEKNWQRSIYRPEPFQAFGQTRSTSVYGIRMVWRQKESKVLVFSAERCFLSILDVFIFFYIMKYMTWYVVLHGFGSDSKKWTRNIEPYMEHYDFMEKMRRKSQIAGGRNKTVEEMAREVMVEMDQDQSNGDMRDGNSSSAYVFQEKNTPQKPNSGEA